MKYIKYVFVTISTMFMLSIVSGCGEKTPELLIGNSEMNVSSNAENCEEEASFDELSVVNGSIFVHISGCVQKPGLYELPVGSRLNDGVLAAGGFSKMADQDYANLAEVLVDGRQYEILSWQEVKRLEYSEKQENEAALDSHYDSEGRLDINVASKEEFTMLPGIGDSKAVAIINYRVENGSFASVDDIKNVSGIGAGIFNQISSYIVVR